MACAGNIGELCGAGSQLSVWSLPGYNAPPPANGAASGSSTGGGAPVSTAVVGATYLGCYSETGSPRALVPGFVANNSISVSVCAAIAQQQNLPFFGLEYATQCLYGNTLNSGSTILQAAKCYMPCNGNTRQICGGSNAISLYNNTLFVTPGNPNPVTAMGLSIEYSYLGCYSEPPGARALGGNAQFDSYTSGVISNLTVEYCALICVDRGFNYMGVENGNQCQCNGAGVINGATISAGGDGDCSTTCTGNGAEYCGANSKINVYHRVGSQA
jgi:WSC domain